MEIMIVVAILFGIASFLISSDAIFTAVLVILSVFWEIFFEDSIGSVVVLTFMVGVIGYRIMLKIDDKAEILLKRLQTESALKETQEKEEDTQGFV